MGSVFQEFVAGWWGGVAGLIVGHPFDTVKSRLQTQGVGGQALRYHGTIHCFTDIVKTEGFRGLYKGLTSPLLGMAAINATVFGVYGISMRTLDRHSCFPLFVNSSLSGAAAGLVQSFICSPVELIKLRMQVQGIGTEKILRKKGSSTPITTSPTTNTTATTINGGNYRGPLKTALNIVQTEGPLGLSKGLVVTLGREVPAFAVYFLTYDLLCSLLAEGKSISDLGPFELCTAGGVSGINAWLITYPLDVVKSRLQVDGVHGPRQYTGIIDCFRKSYHADGWKVFFRGLNSTLVRAFPVNGATFATVAYILRFWRRNE